MPTKAIKKAIHETKEDNERGARRAVLEDLFYDFNRSRAQVYVMNFVRGMLFGAGSVIGGTVVIAALIWILSMLANVVPPLDDFFNGISTTLESGER